MPMAGRKTDQIYQDAWRKIDDYNYFVLTLLPRFRMLDDDQKCLARPEIFYPMRRVQLLASKSPQQSYAFNILRAVDVPTLFNYCTSATINISFSRSTTRTINDTLSWHPAYCLVTCRWLGRQQIDMSLDEQCFKFKDLKWPLLMLSSSVIICHHN